MPGEHEVLRFGAKAVRLGFATPEAVDQCLRIQDTMKGLGILAMKLGEIMLAKGYLTEAQIRPILEYREKRVGPLSISGYKILTKIGQGSMGSIYKALQISMDRIVAIKCLSSKYASNERFRERFLREARAVARLNHPNIIQGIDVGESNGVHYFAMEYIDGPTVGELLKRGGALDEKRALNIVTQIARALNHAFNHGIIHRDVKPDNIILTREGVAKLCDLGLAKLLAGGGDASGTKPGTSMGTPYYIAPEQARGEKKIDTRADIYSLGATFYHMVTGEVPFPGPTAADVIAKHLHEPLAPPRQRNPMVHPAVEHVLLKMMQKSRFERYQTPAELLRDLEAILGGGSPEGFAPPVPVAASAAPAPSLPDRRRTRILRRAQRLRNR